MLFGAHVSIAGGVQNAPENAHGIGCETFQMFSRSPRGGKSNITAESIKQFRENLSKYQFNECFIHSPYYINLASSNKRIRNGSIEVLRDELELGTKLGVKAMMTHLGSSKDYTEDEALNLVIDGIDHILEGYNGTTQFLIEISAGSGKIIGDSFEEIGKIIRKIENKNVGVCFDTCHAFASGYDLRTKSSIDDVMKQFDMHIGLEKMIVLHLNDSMVELASHKDRHQDIGEGLIGREAFSLIVNHPKLKDKCGIIETPRLKLSDASSLDLLKKLRK